MDKVQDDINEKGLSADEVYTTVLYGGVCHRTSTPHKSGNKMKVKNKCVDHQSICGVSDFQSNCKATDVHIRPAHSNKELFSTADNTKLLKTGYIFSPG